MENSPQGVSCVCMHYGRGWLLAEAVESYLKQDYKGPSELIVVNDFEGITIKDFMPAICNDNQYIRVVNLPKRMTSLNDKFDLGVKLAKYPLVSMWDDDDISLPHRLSQSVSAWHEHKQPGYLSMSHHYNYDIGSKPTVVARGVHGGDIFTKEAYTALSGSQGDGHNDENFVAKAKADGIFVVHDNQAAPAYIYRWGGITGHNSCYGRDLATCMQKFHDDVVRDPMFRRGRLQIVPSWGEDYVEVCGG